VGVSPQKHRLSPKARRALELLANNPFGVNEDLLLGHGFSRGMTAGLVRAGLVPLRVGGRTVQVTHVRISDIGRKAIEG
jgi:hypothetical protein